MPNVAGNHGPFLLCRAIALAVFLSPFPCLPLPPETPVSSRELKAALILRLVEFVEWPPEARESTVFPLCVVGDEGLAEVLRKLARSAKSHAEVQSHQHLKGVAACRLLVVGAYDEALVRSYFAVHRNDPVLTVGLSEEFVNSGGMIRLRLEGGRVGIDLNLKAATAARLQISSRLARLARLVQPSNGGAW